MRFLILFSLLLVANLSVAQNWAPNGATWTFETREAFGPEIHFQKWTAVDTVFNGKSCKYFQISGMPSVDDMDMFTYEDSGVVFLMQNDTFNVLYDFNKNKGESWVVLKDTCPMKVFVDSTSTLNINGNSLKVQYVSVFGWQDTTKSFSEKIIQNIGFINSHSVFQVYCRGGIADGTYINKLRCYQDTVIGFYSSNIAPSCEYVSIKELSKKEEIKLFPNPANEKLFIQVKYASTYNYKVYNSLGQVIFTGKSQLPLTSVETALFGNGMYILELDKDNSVTRKCFIISR